MTDHLLFHVKVPTYTSALGLQAVTSEHSQAIIDAKAILEDAGLSLDRADHHEPVAPAVKPRAPRRTAAQIDAEAQALARGMAAE